MSEANVAGHSHRSTRHTHTQNYWQLCTCCAYYIHFGHLVKARERDNGRVSRCEQEEDRERDPDRGSLNSPFRCIFDLESMKRCMKNIYEAKIVCVAFRIYQMVNRSQPTFICRLPFRKFHGNFN